MGIYTNSGVEYRRTGPIEKDIMSTHKALSGGRRARPWIARFGIVGFLFFLVKGLLWLIVPAVAAGAWL